MFREYFILLLLAHIIGDFYFQSEKIASFITIGQYSAIGLVLIM